MESPDYLMENEEESLRLDMKTDRTVVERQAAWAGIRPGMRVADICCGSGKTTRILHELAQPGGITVGVDCSEGRVSFAKEHYGRNGVEFVCKDVRQPLGDLGTFDFVWVRFLLEYYRSSNFQVVSNISTTVKPGGILCLIDLDHNCLNHFGLSQRLERTLFSLMRILEEKADFDPYSGRKLYSHLYKLGYREIEVALTAHHLIYGELSTTDAFNWKKKIEVVSRKVNFRFDAYDGGYDEFIEEFNTFFRDPCRFTYTPAIWCRGRKPLS